MAGTVSESQMCVPENAVDFAMTQSTTRDESIWYQLDQRNGQNGWLGLLFEAYKILKADVIH